MKRIVSISLILLLVFSVFAFAGGNKDAAGRIPLTFSFWGNPDEYNATASIINAYNASQNKVFVTPIQMPVETYVPALNIRATAGNLPDMGMMVEQAVIQYANEGLLADVSSMYGPNDRKPLDSLAFKSADGKVLAYSSSNEILLLYYNKDMFDRAGVPYPPSSADRAWTWDEFVATAKRLTFDTSGRTPNDAGFNRNQIRQYGAFVDTWTWQLEVWALSNGGGFYNSNGTQVTIDQDAAIEAIQRVADLHLRDNVAPLSPGLTDDGIQRSILTGTVAMATGGQWNVGTAFPGSSINYGVAVLPYMKNKVTINTSGSVVVFGQTKYPREAMDFVKWYNRLEEGGDTWNNLVKSGIWMPPFSIYYTDEAYTRRWVENPNFPPYDEYKSAVVDFARNNAQPTSWYYTPNTNEFLDLLRSVLGDVWTGARTAREAITQNAAALKRIHAQR
jgi:multiple sugar transport system substrate-binding protein